METSANPSANPSASEKFVEVRYLRDVDEEEWGAIAEEHGWGETECAYIYKGDLAVELDDVAAILVAKGIVEVLQYC